MQDMKGWDLIGFGMCIPSRSHYDWCVYGEPMPKSIIRQYYDYAADTNQIIYLNMIWHNRRDREWHQLFDIFRPKFDSYDYVRDRTLFLTSCFRPLQPRIREWYLNATSVFYGQHFTAHDILHDSDQVINYLQLVRNDHHIPLYQLELYACMDNGDSIHAMVYDMVRDTNQRILQSMKFLAENFR